MNAAELLELGQSFGTPMDTLYAEGVTATWKAWQAPDAESPALLAAAEKVLTRVVRLHMSRTAPEINRHLSAETHLAHLPLYGAWAQGEETRPCAIAETQDNLSIILQGLLDDRFHVRRFADRYADHSLRTTYKMLLNRHSDLFHVALPPIPGTEKKWQGTDEQFYPPCNTAVTTSDNRLMPSIVRLQSHDDSIMEPGIFYVDLGVELVNAATSIPEIERTLPESRRYRLDKAVKIAARYLIQEVVDDRLRPHQQDFLEVAATNLRTAIEAHAAALPSAPYPVRAIPAV